MKVTQLSLPVLTSFLSNVSAFTAYDARGDTTKSPIHSLIPGPLYGHGKDELPQTQHRLVHYNIDVENNLAKDINAKVGNRRASLKTMTGIAASIFIASSTTSSPLPAHAGSLLEEFGTDPKKISQPSSPPPVKVSAAKSKDASIIEPNLRSNYYYPTNKKRYLPRIKKCNDAIPEAANSIGIEDWDAVSDFALKVADDTILPLKLYTSSLGGQGTNVKVSFTGEMMKNADKFEKSQKLLVKALKKKDQTSASTALEDMASALLAYRTSGRLLGPDGGGDIPSVDEIRRSACRVQGRTFEQKLVDRDARLKEAASMNN